MWNELTAASWSPRGSSEPAALRDVLSTRFATVPEPLVQFLANTQGAVSPDGTTWFLNAADYAGASQSAFAWNAWKLLSLEAAEHGTEPEFEEVTVVARSIEALSTDVEAAFARTAAVTDVARLLFGNAAG